MAIVFSREMKAEKKNDCYQRSLKFVEKYSSCEPLRLNKTNECNQIGTIQKDNNVVFAPNVVGYVGNVDNNFYFIYLMKNSL
jgi:hypothetical protein